MKLIEAYTSTLALSIPTRIRIMLLNPIWILSRVPGIFVLDIYLNYNCITAVIITDGPSPEGRVQCTCQVYSVQWRGVQCTMQCTVGRGSTQVFTSYFWKISLLIQRGGNTEEAWMDENHYQRVAGKPRFSHYINTLSKSLTKLLNIYNEKKNIKCILYTVITHNDYINYESIILLFIYFCTSWTIKGAECYAGIFADYLLWRGVDGYICNLYFEGTFSFSLYSNSRSNNKRIFIFR